MFQKESSPAFTLIELLVVISIIGILSTLSVVALNNARSKARDARRLSDIKQINLALELYYNETGVYPPASGTLDANIAGLCLSDIGISSTCGTLVYLQKIPGDPLNNRDYQYRQLSNGLSYRLFAQLENDIPEYPSGSISMGPNGHSPDLLVANGIDWRKSANWSCSNVAYDANLDALKIEKIYLGCVSKTLIPINTANNYYLSAEYMTVNDVEKKLFYMGSQDYSETSTVIGGYNYNYFAVQAKSTSTNIWTKIGNSQPHTGESTTGQSNQWRPGTAYTKIMFLANYNAPVVNQITYIRNIRFYTE